MCICDHKNLGRRRHEIQKMVNVIGLVAATLGNVQMFKWPSGTTFILKTFACNMMYSIKLQTMDT
jgi:hypothetical protein